MKWDKWQEEYKAITKGNTIILGGRQIGKSEIESEVEYEYLLNTPNAFLLIVSGVERQATGLFEKILAKFETRNKYKLCDGKDRPLKTWFKLKNGAQCITEPLGVSGGGARQHTITRLVVDEMQLVGEDAYAALTPMLLTTGGDIKLLGTAFATEGYVWDRLSDDSFKVFRINSEEVAEQRPEPQRSIMMTYLAQERKRLTEAQYAQEYLAIPQNKLRQVFDDELIMYLCVLDPDEKKTKGKYYGGSDIGGLGEDVSSFEVFNGYNKEDIRHVFHLTTQKQFPHQTAEKIIDLHKHWNFQSYGLDDGGLGVGVLGLLLKNPSMARVVKALNNARRSTNRDETQKTRLLKEDMYMNLLTLARAGKIKLIRDADIRSSLKSCQYEMKDGKMLIFGNNTHIAEGIIRAVWEITQDKSLNIWAASKTYGIRG